MSLHRRAPRSLSGALGDLEQRLAPQTLLAEVQTYWRAVVGEAISTEAEPISERAGTLTVKCSAAVWAHELELMSEEILAAINQRLTRGQIGRLRCVVKS